MLRFHFMTIICILSCQGNERSPIQQTQKKDVPPTGGEQPKTITLNANAKFTANSFTVDNKPYTQVSALYEAINTVVSSHPSYTSLSQAQISLKSGITAQNFPQSTLIYASDAAKPASESKIGNLSATYSLSGNFTASEQATNFQLRMITGIDLSVTFTDVSKTVASCLILESKSNSLTKEQLSNAISFSTFTSKLINKSCTSVPLNTVSSNSLPTKNDSTTDPATQVVTNNNVEEDENMTFVTSKDIAMPAVANEDGDNLFQTANYSVESKKFYITKAEVYNTTTQTYYYPLFSLDSVNSSLLRIGKISADAKANKAFCSWYHSGTTSYGLFTIINDSNGFCDTFASVSISNFSNYTYTNDNTATIQAGSLINNGTKIKYVFHDASKICDVDFTKNPTVSSTCTNFSNTKPTFKNGQAFRNCTFHRTDLYCLENMDGEVWKFNANLYFKKRIKVPQQTISFTTFKESALVSDNNSLWMVMNGNNTLMFREIKTTSN